MHTPDEAKELWCPMVRIARVEVATPLSQPTEIIVAGCNTDALGRTRVPASCRCVADQCAMWRWHDSTRLMTHGPGVTTSLLMPGTGQHDWIPAKGFCGLAPQHAVPSAAFTITQQKP